MDEWQIARFQSFDNNMVKNVIYTKNKDNKNELLNRNIN